MQRNKFSKLSQEWFQKAEEDLEVALLLFRERNYPASACFHLHQAAEKYLKGSLVSKGKDIKEEFKIHNLPKLYGYLKQCSKELPESLKESCFQLNRYYTETRYPGETPQYSWKEVEKSIEAAERIKKEILKIISISK